MNSIKNQLLPSNSSAKERWADADSSSSEEESYGARQVKSAGEKRQDKFVEIKTQAKNHMKIKDFASLAGSYDELFKTAKKFGSGGRKVFSLRLQRSLGAEVGLILA